jgi:hypothetical protein
MGKNVIFRIIISMNSIFDNSFRKQFMFKKIDKVIYLLSVHEFGSAKHILYQLHITTDINFNYIIDNLENEETLKCLINWRNYYI